MKINVTRIPETGFSLEAEEAADHFPTLVEMVKKKECEFLDPLSFNLNIRMMGELVETAGELTGHVRIACDRCLSQFDRLLRRKFTLYFTRTLPESEDASTKDGIEVTEEETGLILFKGDEIDLTEALQEQVVLSFPAWPLCNPVCKGLCPKCGKDLNEGNCDCDSEEQEGPFSVLKNLKID